MQAAAVKSGVGLHHKPSRGLTVGSNTSPTYIDSIYLANTGLLITYGYIYNLTALDSVAAALELWYLPHTSTKIFLPFLVPRKARLLRTDTRNGNAATDG